jgi:GT2 family glycosyltransferase
MLKVLIGIPTYNGAHRVDCLLRSISIRTDKDIDYKIIICDDSGKKDHQKKTENIVNKWKDRIPAEILINDKNMGVGASWNRLVRSCDSEYIVIIDDDIIVEKDWLKNMIYFLENNPNAGMVCYNFLTINEGDMVKLSSPDTVRPRKLNIENFKYDQNASLLSILNTAGIFGFDRNKYNTIGGFDENYRAIYEEIDFFTTLTSLGYPCYMLKCPNSWHVWGATFRNAPEIDLPSILNRSEKYYNEKWHGNPNVVSIRHTDNIPLQKVKWVCKDITYEKLLERNYESNKQDITYEEYLTKSHWYDTRNVRDFVIYGYRNVLKREPDPGGLEHYVRYISSGGITKERFLEILRNSEEYKIIYG